MVTRWVLFLNIFLNFTNYSEVGCVLETVQQIMSLIFFPSTNTKGAQMPLIMTVNKFDKSSLANFPILTNNMWNNFKKFHFFCPAQTVEEIKLNKERSQTRNSLFLTDYYINEPTNGEVIQNNNEDMKNGDDEYIKHTCKKRVKVFMRKFQTTHDDKIQYFSAGFEVCKYSDGELIIKSTPMENHENLQLDEKFEWIDVICIHFDPIKYDVISVTNQVDMYYNGEIVRPSRKSLPEEIYEEGDYDFGKKVVFRDFDISLAYQLENQKNVFHRLFGSSSSRGNPSYFHEIQGRYLVKVHLAPLDELFNPILKRAARTYANIAPMWKIIRENAWFKVENYANLISQAIPGIDLETGTYEVLALSGKEIHLAGEERVRVPQAFWKIIHYTPKRTDEFYNIIIVTVNNPYENTPEVICKENQCAKLGWEYVQQDHFPMGLTSCCELTSEIIQMIKTAHFNVDEKSDFGMNLNALPHWKTPKLTLNVKQFLEDRMNNPSNSIRVDHPTYRNEKDILLDSEIEEKNKPKAMGENQNDQGMISNILENYVVPSWAYLSNCVMRALM